MGSRQVSLSVISFNRYQKVAAKHARLVTPQSARVRIKRRIASLGKLHDPIVLMAFGDSVTRPEVIRDPLMC
jgi:hypothetical protein